MILPTICFADVIQGAADSSTDGGIAEHGIRVGINNELKIVTR